LSSIDELSTADNLIDLLSQTEIDNQTTSVPSTDSMDIVTSPMVSSVHGPITHSVDKVPSSTPKTVHYLKILSELVSDSVKLIR
jgi:hypothetical protein